MAATVVPSNLVVESAVVQTISAEAEVAASIEEATVIETGIFIDDKIWN
jgi:hypothetical protein